MNGFLVNQMKGAGFKCAGLILISMSLFFSVYSFSKVHPQNSGGEYPFYNLNAYLSYYIDQNKVDHAETIRNKSDWIKNTTGEVLNFGFVDYAAWIRFTLDFSDYEKKNWHLVIPYPLLQNAELYLYSSNSGKLLWKSTLQDARKDPATLRSHNINFALPKNITGKVQVLMRVESTTSLQVPVELWAREYLIARQNIEGVLWGGYFGVMIALLLYNSFLFISMRDITYGYYVMTLVSVVILMLSISGLGVRYIWDSHEVIRYTLPISSCFTSLWLLCFSLSFLKKESLRPGVRLLMQTLSILAVVIAGYVLYVPDLGAFIAGCIGVLTVLVVMSAGINALFSGVEIARYFVFATAAFALGAALYLANIFGFLPASKITNHAFQVGSMLEALLFSFALAHRIKEERRQKLIAMEKMEVAQRAIVGVQEQALQQALHDPITKLPNDSLLNNRIGELIHHRSGFDSFALILLYFPQLKEISSSMGRRMAEDLFATMTGKLNDELSKDIQAIAIEISQQNFVAVTEFGSVVFLCKLGEEYRSIHDFSEKIFQLHEPAFDVGGTSTRMKLYCGIATYPKHGDRPDLLVQHASAARDSGLRTSDRLTIYSSEIDAFGRRRLAIVGALAQAIRQKELELYLQPQFSCRANRLCGAEVLLRWNSEKFGVVSPVEFIEVAEEAGLMSDLTRFVIDESFQLLRSFHESGLVITLSINLSIQNLMEAKLISYVTETAERYMVNLADVVFEVTETKMSDDIETVIENLNQLASCGCSIALDDYGTGYSSLAYLSRLPIHELKIDRSFICQMERSDGDYRIVENTVKLARALQIQTVAEGVENADTLSAITRMGCDRVQGFYLAKPMPVSQFKDWVLRRAS